MAKKTLKKMLNLCYDEFFPELHRELISIEVDSRKHKNYESAMQQVIEAIYLYTEDFPEDTYEEVQNIYEEYLESLEK